MEINVNSVYLGTRAVLPQMYRQGRGAIVNTASEAGIRGVARLGPYVASKHAVVGLTKTSAIEAAPHGVRVNAIAPGQIATRMIESLQAQWSGFTDREAIRNQLLLRIPLGGTLLRHDASLKTGLFASEGNRVLTHKAALWVPSPGHCARQHRETFLVSGIGPARAFGPRLPALSS